MRINNYKEMLETVEIREVSFGSTTIYLFSADELNKSQIGYSIDPNGNSLVGSNDGDWKQNWLVIGYEDLCGDPIFVDLESEELTVLTAMHGTGCWNEQNVADSFTGFAKILELIREISTGRTTPELLEKNPLSSKEKRIILEQIKEYSPNSSTDFWENLLEMELWEVFLPANHKLKLPK